MTQTLEHRLVVVIDKKLEGGAAMNACAHMAAGLVALVAGQNRLVDMRFDDYVDADGNRYPSISDHPFIVLRGTTGAIRTLVINARQREIACTVFLDTMTLGSYVEQKDKTAETPEPDIVMRGACLFGADAVIRELTRKFSLWK